MNAVQNSDKLSVISQKWNNLEIWHRNVCDKPDGSWRWQAVDLSWQDRQHHRPQCIGSTSQWGKSYSLQTGPVTRR